jgi:hypothetical protein
MQYCHVMFANDKPLSRISEAFLVTEGKACLRYLLLVPLTEAWWYKVPVAAIRPLCTQSQFPCVQPCRNICQLSLLISSRQSSFEWHVGQYWYLMERNTRRRFTVLCHYRENIWIINIESIDILRSTVMSHLKMTNLFLGWIVPQFHRGWKKINLTLRQ